MNNKYYIIILICYCLVYSLGAVDFEDPVVNDYYNKVLTEKYFNAKIDMAVKLGELQTEAAKQALLALLDHDSYWERTAGAKGLLLFDDDAVREALTTKMLEDHMIDDEIIKGIKNKFSDYSPLLQATYERYPGDDYDSKKYRKKVLEIFATATTAEGETFLKQIVEQTSSPDRSIAFEHLVKNYKETNYTFIKKYLNDEQFRIQALNAIVEIGTADDLPIFIEVIKKNEDGKLVVKSYEAVNKWATSEQKKEIYLLALKKKNNTLVQAALLIFDEQSNAITRELMRQAKNNPIQNIRVTAVEKLVRLGTLDVVPAAIPILKEQFISDDSINGADVIASIFSLGFTSLIDKYSKKQTRKNFYNRLSVIAKKLVAITGVDNGTDYRKWFDWAIYQGYTVEGVNILQYLFSAYPERREKALAHSYVLIGYANERDFLKKNPSLVSKGEYEYILEIAHFLIKKGYLKNSPN